MKYQYNEMRPVLHAINQLMQRVDAANLREKQFMADAAHELRTPIAAVLAQIHLLKQIDDRRSATKSPRIWKSVWIARYHCHGS